LKNTSTDSNNTKAKAKYNCRQYINKTTSTDDRVIAP
jgi:hypothetical protein